MSTLNTLQNQTRASKRCKRVGRGPGSGLGKTSGRGQKGAGARSGHKHRHTYEGGQTRFFEKLPCRGFTRGRWKQEVHTVNLKDIELLFTEGETVNIETLKQHGYLSGPVKTLKVLGEGELKKKVSIEAHAFSDGARSKLEAEGISFKLIERKPSKKS